MQTDLTLKSSISGSGGQKPAVPVARAEVVAATQPRQPVQEQPATSEQLEAAVAELAQAMQSVQRNLNFSIDDASGQTVVKVIDSDSQEVIRQFPSEEALALAARMKELSNNEMSGLLLSSQA